VTYRRTTSCRHGRATRYAAHAATRTTHCGNSIPVDSSFRSPLEVMNEAQVFSAAELASEHMEQEITKWTKEFTWIEDEPQNTCVRVPPRRRHR